MDKDLLDAVLALAREVGAWQCSHFRRPRSDTGQKADKEFVSGIDVESEDRLREGLARLLPGTGFHGEERGGA